MNIELSKFFPPKFCTWKILGIPYFSNLIDLVCHIMLEHEYFHPILDKKDQPEDKELVSPSYPIHPGRYQRLYHHRQLPLSYNTKVTK